MSVIDAENKFMEKILDDCVEKGFCQRYSDGTFSLTEAGIKYVESMRSK